MTNIATTLEAEERESTLTIVTQTVSALNALLMIPLVSALIDHLRHNNSIALLSNVPLTIASGIEITISLNANKLFLKEIAPQNYQIWARFITLTSSMEIIVKNQLNKARMVSMLQCV